MDGFNGILDTSVFRKITSDFVNRSLIHLAIKLCVFSVQLKIYIARTNHTAFPQLNLRTVLNLQNFRFVEKTFHMAINHGLMKHFDFDNMQLYVHA